VLVQFIFMFIVSRRGKGNENEKEIMTDIPVHYFLASFRISTASVVRHPILSSVAQGLYHSNGVCLSMHV
jgi:hypothetical protein